MCVFIPLGKCLCTVPVCICEKCCSHSNSWEVRGEVVSSRQGKCACGGGKGGKARQAGSRYWSQRRHHQEGYMVYIYIYSIYRQAYIQAISLSFCPVRYTIAHCSTHTKHHPCPWSQTNPKSKWTPNPNWTQLPCFQQRPVLSNNRPPNKVCWNRSTVQTNHWVLKVMDDDHEV